MKSDIERPSLGVLFYSKRARKLIEVCVQEKRMICFSLLSSDPGCGIHSTCREARVETGNQLGHNRSGTGTKR